MQVIYFIQSKRESLREETSHKLSPKGVRGAWLHLFLLSQYYELIIIQSINVVKFYQSLFFATMDQNDVSVHKHPDIHYIHGYILSINSSDFALLFVLRKKISFLPYNENKSLTSVVLNIASRDHISRIKSKKKGNKKHQ